MIDTLAKHYALKRMSRLQRILTTQSLSFAERYGLQLHPTYLSHIERALEDGWDHYRQFAKANASDERLKETVETVSDVVRTNRLGLQEIMVQMVDTPIEALTAFTSPLISVLNFFVATASFLGLRSVIRRRAARRLLEPFNPSGLR